MDYWGGLRSSSSGAAQLGGHSGPTLFQRKTTPEMMIQTADTTSPFAERRRGNWTDHEAPKLLVAETHRQLEEMHNAQYAPEPIEAAYMDWSDDPYGGAVHFGESRLQVLGAGGGCDTTRAGLPLLRLREACSTNQTWVEGALETAEIVLQKHLGMGAPGWITPSPKA